MRRPPAATTASADHPTDDGITSEPGLGGGSGMGTAIVRGHDLDVLVPTPAVAVLVLDTGVRELHVSVVVRQLVLPRPPRYLFRLAIRPTVTVFLAAIALVQNSL